ncbi:unnamed protein product, partial [Amoebophrya sp. A25]
QRQCSRQKEESNLQWPRGPGGHHKNPSQHRRSSTPSRERTTDTDHCLVQEDEVVTSSDENNSTLSPGLISNVEQSASDLGKDNSKKLLIGPSRASTHSGANLSEDRSSAGWTDEDIEGEDFIS